MTMSKPYGILSTPETRAAKIIATLQADLKAAQDENARLREALKGVRTIINPMPEANASYEAQLDFVLDQEIDAIEAIDKALQPTPEVSRDHQSVSE